MPNTNYFAIVLFLIYIVLMFVLSFLGSKKTKTLQSFTTAGGSMGVGVVALSLASSFTSAATLISMPGYVYQAGLSGIVYFNIFQTVGLLLGVMIVGNKVRRMQSGVNAYSIPEWLRKKYQSRPLGVIFAIISVFLITFMILIVVLMGNVLNRFLNVPYAIGVILITAYVFAYSLFGGSYTHGWTGMMQSVIMIVTVVWLVVTAIPSATDWSAFTSEVVKTEPYYFSITNPNGIIFKDHFEVIYCAFLMGFCNVFQPHLFNKALYLKKEKSWTLTSILGFVVISIFNLALLLGLFIRVHMPNLTNYDTLFLNYIMNTMSRFAIGLIFVMLMAAAMSTLNGVIIGTVTNLTTEVLPKSWSDKRSLATVRVILAAMGVVVILFSLSPPNFILIIGMWGYNVLMSAALVPMVCSIWLPKVSKYSVIASTITTVVVFLAIMISRITFNGAWACGWAVPAGVIMAIIVELVIRAKSKAKQIRG